MSRLEREMETTVWNHQRESRPPLGRSLRPYLYGWPKVDLRNLARWRFAADRDVLVRDLPETRDELAKDSAWPAFFPSPMCLATVRAGSQTGLEKVVGASIVNRFPYILALSFCKDPLSPRHHPRRAFMDLLEKGQGLAVQFLVPGQNLDGAMSSILTIPEAETGRRLRQTGLATRPGLTNDAPVFDVAYLVYEARLVKPGKDLGGEPIFPRPWLDVGSHRVYFLEINAIQLREDIAAGRSQIAWRSLPFWNGGPVGDNPLDGQGPLVGYLKGYSPHYRFPSPNTVAFQADGIENGRAFLHLPPLAQDQVEVDNDRARWPCFFPSSVGMITSWAGPGLPNLMPCGSTTVLSRHPLVIAPCVSYTAINARYAPRATLDIIRRNGRFGCGVPYLDDAVVNAIKYAGNISIARDQDKVARSGLPIQPDADAPVLPSLPIHFKCEVIGEVRLGTHLMFLGRVNQILVRSDVTAANPIEWCPWADVVAV
jgi:flavin reductase (DIM6/NTAB) family NADH-FMN oxidoreductase RutF